METTTAAELKNQKVAKLVEELLWAVEEDDGVCFIGLNLKDETNYKSFGFSGPTLLDRMSVLFEKECKAAMSTDEMVAGNLSRISTAGKVVESKG